MEFLGAALGGGIFSVLIAYGLYKLLRIREVLNPWVAALLAAAASTGAVAMVSAASGTSEPMAWLAAVAAPGAVIGAAMASRVERKRASAKES